MGDNCNEETSPQGSESQTETWKKNSQDVWKLPSLAELRYARLTREPQLVKTGGKKLPDKGQRGQKLNYSHCPQINLELKHSADSR